MRKDFTVIDKWVAINSHVVDLGCGDGSLFKHLKKTKNISGYGIDNDLNQAKYCLEKCAPILQYNIEEWSKTVDTKSFDYVILSNSIQTLKRPDLLLEEMMRIGNKVIVSFPNMAYWYCRYYILIKGRMPVSDSLPAQWYDTKNIHLCTIKDFEDFCSRSGVDILSRKIIKGVPFFQNILPNLMADMVLYLLEKNT